MESVSWPHPRKVDATAEVSVVVTSFLKLLCKLFHFNVYPPIGAYTCNNNQPFVGANNIAYGFVAGSVQGQAESRSCCACYELTFTSSTVVGQKMIVQVTNTGSDLSTSHFDIQIPGGGVGIFNGCQSQWGAPADGWGSRYGGVSSEADCSQLPAQLQAGCKWRFGWFKNADNPTMTYKEVTCPTELTSISGCIRS